MTSSLVLDFAWSPDLKRAALLLYSLLLLCEFSHGFNLISQVLLPDNFFFFFLLGFRNIPVSIPSSSITLFQATLLVKVLVFITGIFQWFTTVSKIDSVFFQVWRVRPVVQIANCFRCSQRQYQNEGCNSVYLYMNYKLPTFQSEK